MVCIKATLFWEAHTSMTSNSTDFQTLMSNKLQNGSIITIDTLLHDAIYNYISSCSVIMNSP